MNILHYFLGFPPFHGGGLMIYATDLAKEQLKMGHSVIMLMPGEYIKHTTKSKIKFYKIQEGLPIYKIVNPQPVSLSGVNNPEEFIKEKRNNNYEGFLRKHNIEILHVHSLIGFPKEFLDEAKKLDIKTIFTTHDYFGLCPRINFFKYDYTLCNNYKQGKDCVLCNYNVPNKINMKRNIIIIFFKYYDLIKKVYYLFKNKNNRLISDEKLDFKNVKIDENKVRGFVKFREYHKSIIENFDTIIFNSSITKNEYAKYINLNNIRYKILPVTHSKIKDNRNVIDYKPIINNKVNFLFMGYLNKKKGFWDLVSVLDEIKEKYSNWQINIYGDYSNIDLKKFDKKFFKFYGRYKHDDLSNIFSNSSVLIIPSKCKETFGFVGLEAYSYGIPALVSENVGFSDFIINGINGLVYKEDNKNKYLKESIIKILENPGLLKKYNEEILKNEFKYLLKEHSKEIVDYYKIYHNRRQKFHENRNINI